MKTVHTNDFYILRSLIAIVVLYAVIALISGIFGVFHTVGVWTAWTALCAFFTYKKIITFPRPSRELLSYILIASAFSVVIAYFSVPTIFSGRDQGALSAAAMQLANNHHLITHSPESTAFFDIYGAGKALNFPGFFYTDDGGLLTQFPLPYITYLAGFFGLCGTTGLLVANSILLFLFIMSLTVCARHYVTTKYTVIFMILLLSSFSIGWFAKFTLSENIAGALLWSATLLYIRLKKSPDTITYSIFFLTLSLLLFARIEGAWFFAIFLLLTLRSHTLRTFITQSLWWRAIFPLTVLFTIGCVISIMNIPFITTMAHVFFDTATHGDTASTPYTTKLAYFTSVYALYGLIGPLILAACLSIAAVYRTHYRKYLLPLVIVLPLFSYYLFPHISGDHPWMLRRFVFAVLPATLLASIFFIAQIPRRWGRIRLTLQYTLIVLLCAANIPACAAFLTYAENATLKEQVHDFSTRFTSRDLLLTDNAVAHSNWSMITNPLRTLNNTHAVYFFNTADFARLNTEHFDHVYLIIPETKKASYTQDLQEHMSYVDTFLIKTTQLHLDTTKTMPPHFPQKRENTTHGIIYELKQ